MISTNQFKNGIAITIGGNLYTIVSFQHVKPGKGGAFVRTKLKNMVSGAVIDKTFRAGEKVQDAFLEEKKLQYLYRSGNDFHFMDTANYEQMTLDKSHVGEGADFLKDGLEVTARLHKHRIIEVTLPTFIRLKVVTAEPGIRGDTAKQSMKPAKLETGKTISVPLFIKESDMIKIDTRTGKYVERT